MPPHHSTGPARKAALFLLTFYLCGCATVEKRGGVSHFTVATELTYALQTAPPCCRSFEGFPYQDLALNKTYDVKVDLTSPAFLFETGKSFFIAYRLPVTTRPWQVQVKSYFSGHAFYPAAIVLDDNFVPTRRISNPQFRYFKPGFIERGHIGGVIEFTTGGKERYLIIHTRDVDMRQELHTSESGYAYSTSAGAVFVPGGNYAHHFAPIGSLEVSAFETK